MAGILGTALTGLMAFQRSLDTTSHNIANVNTEGYSRQRVELSARNAYYSTEGYVGQGVNVANITRSYDQFVNQQLNVSTSAYAESDWLSAMASQVDAIVADNDSSLSASLDSFFSAVHNVANDPASVSARQAMLDKADFLAQQFNTLSSYFDDFRAQTNGQMQATVDDINSYAQAIADLNARIVSDTAMAPDGQLPNDLLDQRDALVTKLAEKINISVLNQDDGSIGIMIGQGQSLVLGANAYELSLQGSSTDETYKDVLVNGQKITQQITGGELSGQIKFRDQVLDPAQQQLGMLAVGLSIQINSVHTQGFDLNGDVGKDLFVLGSSSSGVPVIADPNFAGGGSVSVSYDPANTANLKPSDYRLDYDGASYTLTRLSDNKAIDISGFPGSAVNVEGLTLNLTAAPSGASSFLIRPAFDAAGKLDLAISDPKEIAAASSALTTPGDNTKALELANLGTKSVLSGGRSTFSEAYGELINKVGASTQSAAASRSAQEVLLNQARQTRESLAGVNLDEEAANLIRFQNAYQAAAKAISVANSLFDTIINAVR
ncbi:flagellar hook-associated protein FlgK [Methylosarcina fibrata]|uniref:flagellar hook-associated protein FlgK n=1 Tax=Methylosarcina fibrata TaxID=105972 RepID=UPI0003A8F23A|nr:flagellar hook-associated protein FlgK [Methylosarcina fibrata]